MGHGGINSSCPGLLGAVADRGDLMEILAFPGYFSILPGIFSDREFTKGQKVEAPEASGRNPLRASPLLLNGGAGEDRQSASPKERVAFPGR